jgi:hypothetical protein
MRRGPLLRLRLRPLLLLRECAVSTQFHVCVSDRVRSKLTAHPSSMILCLLACLWCLPLALSLQPL